MSDKEATNFYPFDVNTVIDKLIEICKSERKFRIQRIDNTNRRIILKTGMSLFSYGEIIEVIVNPQNNGSLVYISSKPKAWFNITADKKISLNINYIFETLDRSLGNF